MSHPRPWNVNPDHLNGTPLWECPCDECLRLEMDTADSPAERQVIRDDMQVTRWERWPEAFTNSLHTEF